MSAKPENSVVDLQTRIVFLEKLCDDAAEELKDISKSPKLGDILTRIRTLRNRILLTLMSR